MTHFASADEEAILGLPLGTGATVLKVAHHGSYNATPRSALEQMRKAIEIDPDVVPRLTGRCAGLGELRVHLASAATELVSLGFGNSSYQIGLELMGASAVPGELEAAHLPYEIQVYSGAPHGFTIFGAEGYRKDADEKSWAVLLDWLKASF